MIIRTRFHLEDSVRIIISCLSLTKKIQPPARTSRLPSATNPAKRIVAESEEIPTIAQFSAKPETERWWEFLSWRSGWDSNPRVIAHKLISSQPRYDLFDTAAYLRWDLTAAHHFIEYLIPGGMSIPSLPRPVFKKPPPPDSAAKLELTVNRLYHQTRQAIIYGGMRCEHAYAGNRTPDFKKVHATRYGRSFPDFEG